MPTLRKKIVVVSTFALGFATGCSSTSTGGDESDPLLGTCSGTFTCAADGSSDTVQSTLNASDGSCHAGALRLDADHQVFDEKKGETIATWAGDANKFTICVDGDASACLRCANNARTQETKSAP